MSRLTDSLNGLKNEALLKANAIALAIKYENINAQVRHDAAMQPFDPAKYAALKAIEGIQG